MGRVWVTLHVNGVTDAAVFWLLQVYSTLCGVNAGNTDSGERSRLFLAGEMRNGLIDGYAAGGSRACGARPATDSGARAFSC